MTLKPKRLLVDIRWLHFIVTTLNIEFNYSHKSGCDARKSHCRSVERRWEQDFVRFMDRIHEIYVFERKASTRIYVVRGETDKDSSNYQTRFYVAKSMDQKWKKKLRKQKGRMGEKETKTWQRSIERHLLHRSGRHRLQRNRQKRTQPCLVKRKQSIRPLCWKLQRGLKHPTRFQRRTARVKWNLMNPQDSGWTISTKISRRPHCRQRIQLN